MEGIELIESTELYNILNQAGKYPLLSDPSYLLLFDVRKLDEFMESHITTARLVKQDKYGVYQLPEDAELETKQNIIVYDNTTSSLSSADTAAVMYAKFLWENGSKYFVKIVNGGFEKFSALYPFLRSTEILHTPQQLDTIFTYPIEVIPGFLYLGSYEQSQNGKVNKDLKIKAHVNVSKKNNCTPSNCLETEERNNVFLQIGSLDNQSENVSSFFVTACNFIDSLNIGDGKSVLVYSDLGINRSVTISLAYIMHHHKWTLQDAWNYLKKCKHNMCPNRSFVKQLALWEEDLLGEKVTDINIIEP